MIDDNPIIVEPFPEPTLGRWEPIVGPETLEFLSNVVPEDSRDSVRDAAVSIIAKSVPPTGEVGQETGLIVGYVQSGKTMSFETVVTLARDKRISDRYCRRRYFHFPSSTIDGPSVPRPAA